MKDETHFWSEDVVDAMCRVGTGTEGQEAVPAVCYFVLFKGGRARRDGGIKEQDDAYWIWLRVFTERRWSREQTSE